MGVGAPLAGAWRPFFIRASAFVMYSSTEMYCTGTSCVPSVVVVVFQNDCCWLFVFVQPVNISVITISAALCRIIFFMFSS